MTLPLRTPIRLLIFLAFAGVSLLALVYPRSVPAAPTLTWVPSSLIAEVGAGQSSTTTATFTVSENAKNVTLRVVPELAQYIRVSPSTFTSVTKGASYPVQVTFAPTATATPGTYDGTIHVQQGAKTLAKPLPAQIRVIWPTFAAGEDLGLSIQYPPGWFASETESAVSFSNVADISLVTDTTRHDMAFIRVFVRYNDNTQGYSVSQWFDNVLRPIIADRIEESSQAKIDGNDALYVTLAGIGEERTNIYIVRGTDVIEITYGDYEPKFHDDYKAIVNSLRIAPKQCPQGGC